MPQVSYYDGLGGKSIRSRPPSHHFEPCMLWAWPRCASCHDFAGLVDHDPNHRTSRRTSLDLLAPLPRTPRSCRRPRRPKCPHQHTQRPRRTSAVVAQVNRSRTKPPMFQPARDRHFCARISLMRCFYGCQIQNVAWRPHWANRSTQFSPVVPPATPTPLPKVVVVMARAWGSGERAAASTG